MGGLEDVGVVYLCGCLHGSVVVIGVEDRDSLGFLVLGYMWGSVRFDLEYIVRDVLCGVWRHTLS